jgi:hypothetical protein
VLQILVQSLRQFSSAESSASGFYHVVDELAVCLVEPSDQLIGRGGIAAVSGPDDLGQHTLKIT